MIEPYDIGCEPSPSVPAETLLQDGWDAFLLFQAVSKEIAPKTGYLTDLGCAVLECENALSTRFGYPNDEGLPEHPFYEMGLKDLDTSIAVTSDSAWLSELTRQANASRNRIWGNRNIATGDVREESSHHHFIICLKECTFECIATGLKVVRFAADFRAGFDYVMQRFAQH